MIVSHEHRFVALGNRKCGSSSLMHLLAPFQQESAERIEEARRLVVPELMGKTIPKHFDGPQARAVLEALGADWDEYTKIIVIRNPWRRLVSHYHWRMRNQDGVHDRRSEFKHFSSWIQRRQHVPQLSLDHFSGVHATSVAEYARRGFCIIRLESFEVEIQAALGELGADAGVRTARITKNKGTDVSDHTRYFDRSAKAFVERAFAIDITVGGYSLTDD